MTTHHSNSIVKASAVKGVKVINAQKEDLGKIEEVVIDKATGKVVYLVVCFGGFMGMGEKFHAFPWHSFHYNTEEDCFTLNISKEKLKDAPGFDKNHWPNMAETQWQTNIRHYYGEDSSAF